MPAAAKTAIFDSMREIWARMPQFSDSTAIIEEDRDREKSQGALYLDTSYIAKFYFNEPESEPVRELVRTARLFNRPCGRSPSSTG